MTIKIEANLTYDPTFGDVIDCWIGEEYRTITIIEAVTESERTALVDLEGYDEHWQALWGEIKKEVYFERLTHLMCSDLMEEIHLALAPCNSAEFLSEYLIRHQQKYSDSFLQS